MSGRSGTPATEATPATDDPPVTAIVWRRCEPGREGEVAELLSGMAGTTSGFPGYMGAHIVRTGGEYGAVFKFDRASNLERWMASEERRRWNERLGGAVREEPRARVITGLETWFTLPERAGEAAPPRHRMAAVTWLAAFPLVSAIFFLFGPWLEAMPLLLRTLVLSAAWVPLMAYVVMPRMTRLFAFWLYPRKGTDDG